VGDFFFRFTSFAHAQGRCYALDEIVGWLRQAGFSRIKGPFRSSPLPFDPDSILIATKS
jgi:hypothetical protein